MIKKIVCAALMLSILAMSSMGAFAAVTSTTAYVAGTNDVTVTTTVEGVEAGDTVTYLAYKEAIVGEGPTDANIAYIDQVTLGDSDVVGGVYTFTYTTEDNKLGAVVKQAGLKANGSAISLATDEDGLETPAPTGCTIKVNGEVKATIETQPAAGSYIVVNYSASVESVKVGGTEVEGWYATATGFAIPASLWVEGDLELTVEDAHAITTVTLDGVKGYEDSKVAVATVTGVVNNEFGVIFTTNLDFPLVNATDDSFNAAENSGKFVALAKGSDGQFMITVEGENTVGDTFYAAAFADETVSEFEEVTVKAAE